MSTLFVPWTPEPESVTDWDGSSYTVPAGKWAHFKGISLVEVRQSSGSNPMANLATNVVLNNQLKSTDLTFDFYAKAGDVVTTGTSGSGATVTDSGSSNYYSIQASQSVYTDITVNSDIIHRAQGYYNISHRFGYNNVTNRTITVVINVQRTVKGQVALYNEIS